MSEVTKKRHRLTNMVYDEISFVDVGANQHADVLLVKSYDGGRGSSSPKASAPKQTADWYHSDRTPTDASGQKTDLRALHWEESRHPRASNGTFTGTSGASKKKYGKGGTTGKHRLTAAEKAKKKQLAAEKKKQALANKKVGYRLVMGPGGNVSWQHVKASESTSKTPKPDKSGTVARRKPHKVKKYLGLDPASAYLERD